MSDDRRLQAHPSTQQDILHSPPNMPSDKRRNYFNNSGIHVYSPAAASTSADIRIKEEPQTHFIPRSIDHRGGTPAPSPPISRTPTPEAKAFYTPQKHVTSQKEEPYDDYNHLLRQNANGAASSLPSGFSQPARSALPATLQAHLLSSPKWEQLSSGAHSDRWSAPPPERWEAPRVPSSSQFSREHVRAASAGDLRFQVFGYGHGSSHARDSMRSEENLPQPAKNRCARGNATSHVRNLSEPNLTSTSKGKTTRVSNPRVQRLPGVNVFAVREVPSDDKLPANKFAGPPFPDNGVTQAKKILFMPNVNDAMARKRRVLPYSQWTFKSAKTEEGKGRGRPDKGGGD